MVAKDSMHSLLALCSNSFGTLGSLMEVTSQAQKVLAIQADQASVQWCLGEDYLRVNLRLCIHCTNERFGDLMSDEDCWANAQLVLREQPDGRDF